AVRAELNNFFIELYNENDPTSASSILKHLQTEANLSTPMELSLAEDALMTYVDPKTGKMPNLKSVQGGNKELETQLPDKAGMTQNYPNPFNPATTMSYKLSVSGHVTLKVYDILGREVRTLINDYQTAGVHSVRFDAQNLASGVYFYRLTAPGITQVKKMVVTK
ncbi:MAG: T9SS type A sorting domain-containing protein, partial [Bacteroidetes bacterium]|nr:T9SS type A sorting domain-containing protein [Bacteroidota bacterium]